jgi:CheY-like chemotaxis protein
MLWQGAPVPLVPFAEAVGLVEDEPVSRVVIASTPSGPVGLLVAAEIGRRQVAARELGALLDGAPHVTGAALLGGGDVVVLVEPARMVERWRLPAEPAGPRPRVLVVDDSRGVRQVVGQALGLAGFDVDLAGSPTEALSALAGQRYDAIVMDYVMPTMDGATLVRKARDLGIAAPIVVMSGQATERDRNRAVAAGADAYFDKNDVRRGALAAALRNLVAGKPAGGGR